MGSRGARDGAGWETVPCTLFCGVGFSSLFYKDPGYIIIVTDMPISPCLKTKKKCKLCTSFTSENVSHTMCQEDSKSIEQCSLL